MDPVSARLNRMVPADLPIPETEGFVRAVRGRPPRPATLLAPWYLPLTAFGLVALVAAIAGGWLWLGVLGVLLAVAADLAAGAARSPIAQLLGMSGWDPRVRALVRALLFVALLARTTPELVSWFVAAIAVLQLGWLASSALATALAVRQPMLRFVPGAARQPKATLDYAAVYAFASGSSLGWFEAVAVLLALLGVGPVSVAGYLALTVALVVLVARRLLHGRRVSSHAAADAARLAEELATAAPVAVVHVSAGVGQAKHLLGQWLSALEALPDGAELIVREASQLSVIDPTALPLVYAPGNRSVEQAIPPSARIAFYLSTSGKSTDLLRDDKLRHVFLGHGDSDKSTSASPVARVYDEIWVAGTVAIDRYAAAGVHIPRERFAIVGRPQVEQLRVGALNQQPPTVLYAPTFEGYYELTNYSSLEVMGPALIRSLLAHPAKVRVIFKPHPSTGLHRPGMRAARAEANQLLRAAGPGHVCADDDPSLSLYGAFDAADVLITDVSSVASDFLHTGRPVMVTNPKGFSPAEYFERFPGLAGGYLIDDPAELDSLLTDALTTDSARERRAASATNVLGDHPDGPTASFIAATRRLAGLVPQEPS